MTVFVIEDEFHAEWQGQFQSFDAAFAELGTRASIAWNETPEDLLSRVRRGRVR